eukprot:5742719-Pleurochrysis_carterae.AAC.1
MPREFLDLAFREQFTLGLKSATLALEPQPWLHSLRPCTADQNLSIPAAALTPSLPPSPPMSEQSWSEQHPSQPQVSSARVTRSQSQAR